MRPNSDYRLIQNDCSPSTEGNRLEPVLNICPPNKNYLQCQSALHQLLLRNSQNTQLLQRTSAGIH